MEHRSENIRVCIVDDHELIRDGLRTLLTATDGYEVVGVAGSCDTGMDILLREEPDLAIVDARLPDGNGLDLIRRVRLRKPHVLCLVMTSFPSSDAFRMAVKAGASGYVSKDVDNATLLEMTRRVVRGGTVLDWAGQGDQGVVRLPQPEASDLIEGLTAQERRILDLITQGCTNREIAGELYLAEKTVRNYVSNLLGKLGMRNRTQAATLMASHAGRPSHTNGDW